VKCQCVVVAKMLVIELKRHLVDSKLMDAPKHCVYPQFWMQLDENFYFSLHMSVIKKHDCELKQVKSSLD
jgi:hypothetical protein